MTEPNLRYTSEETVLIPDPLWRPVTVPKLCRWGRSRCGREAQFELNRGYRGHDSWWGYCEDHLYNHVWLDGVMYWPIERGFFAGDEDLGL